jgi:hypothetical protein
MNKCVINLVTPNAWYPNGQKRLINSLKKFGFDGDVLTWIGENKIGAPSHAAVPYAFKPYAFMEAKKRGYDLIQWCDASFWAIKSIDKVFQHLSEHGWVMQRDGNSVGKFCSDAALDKLGITRKEAMDISLFMAGGLGLNLKNEKASLFLDQWFEKANDGASFVGSWTNENLQVSKDPEVRGHRHDMAVGSVIAHKLGMDYLDEIFFSYFQGYEKLANQPKRKNVCMVLQGGA